MIGIIYFAMFLAGQAAPGCAEQSAAPVSGNLESVTSIDDLRTPDRSEPQWSETYQSCQQMTPA